MPDSEQTRLSSDGNPEDQPRRDRTLWQVSVRTLLLIMAAIAVWITVVVNWFQNSDLEQRIMAVRPLARGLNVYDPRRIAVVARDPLARDEEAWYVFLPHPEYRVSLATRGIKQTGLSPALFESRPMQGGRHRIALAQKKTPGGWRISITVDNQQLLAVDENTGWNDGSPFVGGNEIGISEQRSPKELLVLFRRRFTRAVGSADPTLDAPCNGILLWLDPVVKPTDIPKVVRYSR
jgi:hypothetical protein